MLRGFPGCIGNTASTSVLSCNVSVKFHCIPAIADCCLVMAVLRCNVGGEDGCHVMKSASRPVTKAPVDFSFVFTSGIGISLHDSAEFGTCLQWHYNI